MCNCAGMFQDILLYQKLIDYKINIQVSEKPIGPSPEKTKTVQESNYPNPEERPRIKIQYQSTSPI